MSNEKPAEGTILTLVGEDGEQIQFEHIDTLQYNGHYYFALTPLLEGKDYLDADGQLVIMRVEEQADGEKTMVGIDEEDEEFEPVWAMFEERLEDEYELVEDSE